VPTITYGPPSCTHCPCNRIDPVGHVLTGGRLKAKLSTTQVTRMASATTTGIIRLIRTTLFHAAEQLRPCDALRLSLLWSCP
jgi:hypothetical protein